MDGVDPAGLPAQQEPAPRWCPASTERRRDHASCAGGSRRRAGRRATAHGGAQEIMPAMARHVRGRRSSRSGARFLDHDAIAGFARRQTDGRSEVIFLGRASNVVRYGKPRTSGWGADHRRSVLAATASHGVSSPASISLPGDRSCRRRACRRAQTHLLRSGASGPVSLCMARRPLDPTAGVPDNLRRCRPRTRGLPWGTNALLQATPSA